MSKKLRRLLICAVMVIVVSVLCAVWQPALPAEHGWTVHFDMPDSIASYGLEKYHFVLTYWTDSVTRTDTIAAVGSYDYTEDGRIHFQYETAATDSARYSFRISTYIPSNPADMQVSEPSNTVSGLLLDWSMGADVTILKLRGDDTDVLAVYLPYGPWNVQWFSIWPDTVEAWFEYDLNMDYFVSLPDLSFFADGYGSIYGLAEFSMLGGMYNKPALLRYEGAE